MSSAESILIVGGGPAGQAAAAGYRKAGGDGRVTILAAEPNFPYERPPLTKDYLRGETVQGDLLVESPSWYAAHEIDLIRGATVAAIDVDRGLATTEDEREWKFEHCLLATGASPVVPDVPGADGHLVHKIRTIAHADRLTGAGSRRPLVVGSGFIGCEAAFSLAMRGAEVTIASMEAGPQVERLGEEVSERLAGWLEQQGIEFLAEAKLAAIAGEDGTARAEFEDGRSREADAVLLALGISRNDRLAAEAGLEVDEGVPTDAAMRTANPRLLAAGDVAFADNAAAGRRLRVEHWGEALNQGEVAGLTLAGKPAAWNAAPGFWSVLGKRTVKYSGWGDGWDEVRFEGSGEGPFAAWYGRDGELVGVITHKRDDDYERGRKLIEERAAWS
jgi:3-phenylpropionate/trans-cinnamate dioxygenase ferredoxin reductase subunit